MARAKRLFIENVKARLGFRVKGRKVVEVGEEHQLREIIEWIVDQALEPYNQSYTSQAMFP